MKYLNDGEDGPQPQFKKEDNMKKSPKKKITSKLKSKVAGKLKKMMMDRYD